MSKEAAMAIATGTPVIAEAPPITTQTPLASEPVSLESTRFAQFAKKEAQLVKEREAMKLERAKYDEVNKKVQAFEDKRKTDPVAALRDVGFSETEIFNFLAAETDAKEKASNPEEIARRVAQEELKKRDDEQSKNAQTAQEKKNAEIIDTYKKSITDVIKNGADKFKANTHFGPVAEEMAFLVAEEAVKAGDDAPSAQEAAEIVEEYYKMQYEDLKTLFEPKVQAKVEAPVAQDKTKTLAPMLQHNKPKTITNQVVATTASTIQKKESRSEKRERLMRQLAGN